jgi:PAS domain-containing protein
MSFSYQWDAASLVALLAAPVVAVVALIAARQRGDRVARALVWFTLAILIWIVGFAFELAATDLPTLWFWLRLEFIGIVAAGPLWLLVVLRYLGVAPRSRLLLTLLLAVPPLIKYAALLTNDWHHLFYTSIEIDAYGRGPIFWLNAATAYSYFAAAFALSLFHATRAAPAHRRRLLLLVIAATIPLAGNVAYVALGLPSRYDPTPALFAIAGLMVVDVLTRGRLLQARPVALRTALAVATDAILVADADGQVVEANPAAGRLLGRAAAGQLGALLQTLGATPADADRLTSQAPWTCLLRHRDRVLEAQTVPVR